jgi:hypothetical protein
MRPYGLMTAAAVVTEMSAMTDTSLPTNCGLESVGVSDMTLTPTNHLCRRVPRVEAAMRAQWAFA